jgi:thiol-disulfide isomerase/thioredoxin
LAAADKKPSDLALHNLAGKKVQLRDCRGKIVVLNSWATCCGPCREEMPMIVAAEKTWRPKGVVFLAVSLDDSKTRKDIPAFVERYHVGFPVWTGASAEELDKLHMGQGVPDTAFFDAGPRTTALPLLQLPPALLQARASKKGQSCYLWLVEVVIVVLSLVSS